MSKKLKIIIILSFSTFIFNYFYITPWLHDPEEVLGLHILAIFWFLGGWIVFIIDFIAMVRFIRNKNQKWIIMLIALLSLTVSYIIQLIIISKGYIATV